MWLKFSCEQFIYICKKHGKARGRIKLAAGADILERILQNGE